jgi:hypothetical protein
MRYWCLFVVIVRVSLIHALKRLWIGQGVLALMDLLLDDEPEFVDWMDDMHQNPVVEIQQRVLSVAPARRSAPVNLCIGSIQVQSIQSTSNITLTSNNQHQHTSHHIHIHITSHTSHQVQGVNF